MLAGGIFLYFIKMCISQPAKPSDEKNICEQFLNREHVRNILWVAWLTYILKYKLSLENLKSRSYKPSFQNVSHSLAVLPSSGVYGGCKSICGLNLQDANTKDFKKTKLVVCFLKWVKHKT